MALPISDELDQLMLKAATGDQGAFRRFYDLSAPNILALLLRMLRDRFQAEDVLQEAMVIAWRKASDFDPSRAHATTWVTTIARRRALDALRSGSRYDEVLRDGASDIADRFGGDSVEARAPESSATEHKLESCFGELKQGTASAIKLAYLDGLTFPEIARATENSLNTIKSWVRRGIGRLRECMQR